MVPSLSASSHSARKHIPSRFHWVPFRPSNQQCRLQIMGCYASVYAPLFVICLIHRREIVPMFNIFGWDGIAPQKKERRVEKTHITTCRFVLNDIQYMYTVYIYIIYNTCIYIYIIYIYISFIYIEREGSLLPQPHLIPSHSHKLSWPSPARAFGPLGWCPASGWWGRHLRPRWRDVVP